MKFLKPIILVILILHTILFMVGCSSNEKEVVKDTEERVTKVFEKEVPKAKYKGDGFNYYTPFGFGVESQSENNVVLKKGKQTYILFVNPLEKPNSKVVYETSLKSLKENLFSKTFKPKKSQFGYIIVSNKKDEKYELIVGIGGVKISTKAKLENLADSAEIMMEIARSVEY